MPLLRLMLGSPFNPPGAEIERWSEPYVNPTSHSDANRYSRVQSRLRCMLGSGSEWKVEMFGPACRLRDYAA